MYCDFLQEKARKKRRENGETVEDVQYSPQESPMLMMRILGPIINFVNRPWKVSFFLHNMCTLVDF